MPKTEHDVKVPAAVLEVLAAPVGTHTQGEINDAQAAVREALDKAGK